MNLRAQLDLDDISTSKDAIYYDLSYNLFDDDKDPDNFADSIGVRMRLDPGQDSIAELKRAGRETAIVFLSHVLSLATSGRPDPGPQQQH
jgi:hypothetical protein